MIIKIGEKINELRNKNNITQLALAKELGVSRSSVNAWEMGISMPTIDRLIDIAEYFHVSVDYLLGLNDRLTIDISSLNEKEKTMIYNLIEIFINSQKENDNCLSFFILLKLLLLFL